MVRLYAALSRAGLSPRDVSVAHLLMWHYTPADYSRVMVREADRDRFPGLLHAHGNRAR